MGRLQYLERLALGRSAFEDLEPDEQPHRGPSNDDEQQYDEKGRPKNPSTETLEAELCDAQNEVYSLVGVVERKDAMKQYKTEAHGRAVLARRRILDDEHNMGELLEFVAVVTDIFSHRWSNAFLARVQVGFYHPGESMLSILKGEWRLIRGAGLNLGSPILLPGLGELAAQFMIKIPVMFAIEQIAGRLQNYLASRSKTRGSAARRMHRALTYIYEALWVIVDLVIIPATFYGHAQRLRLAPPVPRLTPRSAFSPTSTSSFHRIIWRPLVPACSVRGLTSPGMLMVANKITSGDLFGSQEEIGIEMFTPIFYRFTSFRKATIDAGIHKPTRPPFVTDPFGWLLYQGLQVRQAALVWTGWNMGRWRPTPPGVHELENNVMNLNDRHKPPSLHRATALAQLPAKFLAFKIDDLLAKLITLPLDSLLLRAVARAYMDSPLTPKTGDALRVSHHLYAPFGGGPLATVLKSPRSLSAWANLGGYASHVGLALVMDCSIDIIRFGVLYFAVRWIGTKWYGWPEQREVQQQIRGREEED